MTFFTIYPHQSDVWQNLPWISQAIWPATARLSWHLWPMYLTPRLPALFGAWVIAITKRLASKCAPKRKRAPLLLAATETEAERSLATHLQQSQNNLASTYRRIPDSLLLEIAQAILGARKVWVLGFRSSHALANYFRWQLLQIVPEAHLIPGPGETMGSIWPAYTPTMWW